ncbi:hypothetical protein D9M73_254450 [compost metagenome]
MQTAIVEQGALDGMSVETCALKRASGLPAQFVVPIGHRHGDAAFQGLDGFLGQQAVVGIGIR